MDATKIAQKLTDEVMAGDKGREAMMSEGQFLGLGQRCIDDYQALVARLSKLSDEAEGLEGMYADTPLEKEAEGLTRMAHNLAARLESLKGDFKQLQRLVTVIDKGM